MNNNEKVNTLTIGLLYCIVDELHYCPSTLNPPQLTTHADLETGPHIMRKNINEQELFLNDKNDFLINYPVTKICVFSLWNGEEI